MLDVVFDLALGVSDGECAVTELIEGADRDKIACTGSSGSHFPLPDLELGLGPFGIGNLWTDQILVEEDSPEAIVDHHDQSLAGCIGRVAAEVVVRYASDIAFVLQTVLERNDVDLATALAPSRRCRAANQNAHKQNFYGHKPTLPVICPLAIVSVLG